MNGPRSAQELSVESLLGQAADEFSERLSRGETPDIEEYADRYPQVAKLIRQVFPALSMLRESPDSRSGTDAPLGETKCLGDFRIVREIGRGGMGVVYEAEQISLARRVALKVLPFAAVLDQRHLKRFKNEAQAAAGLHHQNIVPVYGVGCERGVHYYAMQYIEGQTLAEVIRDLRRLEGLDGEEIGGRKSEVGEENERVGSELVESLASGRLLGKAPGAEAEDPIADFTPGARRPSAPDGPSVAAADTGRPVQAAISTGRSSRSAAYFRSVAQIGIQAAEALDHAHEEGVIHRDVKPSNLILDDGGKVWVTDFGLARVEADPGLTMTGDILGTLRYMSPEQALAKRVVVDHRADVYSLGVTLYELLTLQPAFPEKNRQELLRRIAFEEPPAVRKLNRGIPGDLETIVLKAMAKNPAERYATAEELADDLRRFLSGKPISARRTTAMARLARWCRRNPVVSSLAGSVAVLLITGAVLSSLAAVRFVNLAADREAARRQAVAETGKALDARDQAEQARRHEAELRREAVRLRRVAEQREAISQRLLYAAYMKLAHEAWQRYSVPRALELLYDPLLQQGQKCPRGFEWYYLWKLCHREFVQIESKGSVEAIAFSPQGDSVALAGGDGKVQVCNAVTGAVEAVFAHSAGVLSLAFSPDGSILATGTAGTNDSPGVVTLWATETGEKERTLGEHAAGIKAIAFSPDGNTLATGSPAHKEAPGGVKLWNVATGEEVVTFDGHAKGVTSVAFAPDGQSLASGSYDGTIRLWNPATGEVLREWGAHRGRLAGVFALAFSPDGKLLASGGGHVSEDNVLRLWDLTTGQERVFPKPPHKKAVFSVVFSPDGKAVVSTHRDTTVRLWDVATREQAALFRLTHWAYCAAFSPDGKTLAAGDAAGVANLWRVAGDEPTDVVTHSWDNPEGLNQHDKEDTVWGRGYLAYSPDANTLAAGNTDGTVTLLDPDTGHKRATLRVAEAPVHAVAFAPKENVLAVAAGSQGHPERVGLWDVATGERRLAFGDPGLYTAVAFSPDGETLAAGLTVGDSEVGTGFVKLWNGETGRELATLIPKSGGINRIAYSPDGRLLAAASKNRRHSGGDPTHPSRVTLWNTASAERYGAFTWTLHVHCVAFSPDGKMLAASGGSWFRTPGKRGSIKVWDLESLKEVATLQGHPGIATSVCFSPDGRTLATGGLDGNLRIWDTVTWKDRLLLRFGVIDCLVFSPDGRTMVSGNAEGVIKFWRAASDAEVTQSASEVLDAARPLAESHPQRAEQVYQEARDLYQRLAAQFPFDARHRNNLARTCSDLARIYYDAGRYEMSDATFQQALQIWQQLNEQAPGQFVEDLADALVQRGRTYAEKGDWRRAAETFAQAAELRSADEVLRYRLALTRLGAKEIENYRGTCKDMVEHFGPAPTASAVEWTSWTCALGPDALSDLSPLINRIEQAVDKHPDNDRHRNRLGALLYRAGRFEETLDHLERVTAAWEQAGEKPTQYSPAYTWYFLAMAHQRLGHADQAGQWLRRAVDWTNDVLTYDEPAAAGLTWNRRLTLKLLRREAEDLLGVARAKNEPAKDTADDHK